MHFNWIAVLISSLVPLLLGFVWYNKILFGNAWMKAAEMTEEKKKNFNMAKVFGLTFILSLVLSFATQFFVIHQFHFYSILANEAGFNDPDSETGRFISGFMEKYGNNFRTFRHGALHGFLTGLFVIFPIAGVNALFERKSFAYVAINAGFWTACLMIMGGILCAMP